MGFCIVKIRGYFMAIRYLSKIIGFSGAALLAMTTHAEAAGSTVGTLMNNLTTSSSSFPAVASCAAYLLGILFSAQGVLLFKDHVDGASGTLHRGPVPISAGIKRFLAGGMLFSLPYMANAAMRNLIGGGMTPVTNGAVHGAPGGNGTDQMIVAFIANIAQPISFLLMAFGYVSAIILLITGIIRLTHGADQGPKGPTGLGTIMTFVASGALFSIGDLMGTFVNSLFGTTVTSTFAVIGANILADPNDVAQVAPVIEALMSFIMIVGFIAFIRGWFVLKAFADGSSQSATLAQALTFLIGGTMAINLGALVNAIENTVGLTPANAITFQ
jgi:hypothetical protein